MFGLFKKYFSKEDSVIPAQDDIEMANTGEETGLERASKHWGERARELVEADVPSSWTECDLIREEYINPQLSGRQDRGWLESVAREYFPEPVEIALSLGCGGGGLERHGLDLGIAQRFDAYDVSEGAIELAVEEAGKHDRFSAITYRVANLNEKEFPPETYDAVFAGQSVHHIEALEHYMEQVSRTLRPGGLFIMNEFVGPSQFQWTDKQLEHANRLMQQIPEEFRHCIRAEGFRETVERPTIEAMNSFDPTEAIRSAEIIPQVEHHFDLLEKRDFGGTVLHLLLDNIVGNMIHTEEGKKELRRLLQEEHELISSGELTSDFSLLIARKRS